MASSPIATEEARRGFSDTFGVELGDDLWGAALEGIRQGWYRRTRRDRHSYLVPFRDRHGVGWVPLSVNRSRTRVVAVGDMRPALDSRGVIDVQPESARLPGAVVAVEGVASRPPAPLDPGEVLVFVDASFRGDSTADRVGWGLYAEAIIDGRPVALRAAGCGPSSVEDVNECETLAIASGLRQVFDTWIEISRAKVYSDSQNALRAVWGDFRGRSHRRSMVWARACKALVAANPAHVEYFYTQGHADRGSWAGARNRQADVLAKSARVGGDLFRTVAQLEREAAR